MFLGYHLSRYQTDDPTLPVQLLQQAITQTKFWEETLKFSDEQKKQTLFLSQTSAPTETEKGKFTVLVLVPLDDAHPSFSAIWDGLLRMTLVENVSLKLVQVGIEEGSEARNITSDNW